MRKYTIKYNESSKNHYDLVIVDDNNNETIVELTSKTTDGYLRLPENDLGQKMIALKKLSTTDYELQKHESRRASSSHTSTSKDDFLKALALCLNEDERKTFNDLLEKAKSRFAIFKQKETLKKQIAEAQAALDAMTE